MANNKKKGADANNDVVVVALEAKLSVLERRAAHIRKGVYDNPYRAFLLANGFGDLFKAYADKRIGFEAYDARFKSLTAEQDSLRKEWGKYVRNLAYWLDVLIDMGSEMELLEKAIADRRLQILYMGILEKKLIGNDMKQLKIVFPNNKAFVVPAEEVAAVYADAHEDDGDMNYFDLVDKCLSDDDLLMETARDLMEWKDFKAAKIRTNLRKGYDELYAEARLEVGFFE